MRICYERPIIANEPHMVVYLKAKAKFFLSKTPTTSNRSHFSFEKLKKITSISQKKQFPLA